MPIDQSYRTIELPSRGLLYDGLIPNGIVKCMIWDTTTEELFSGGSSSPTNLISEVLERSLVDLPIPVNDLLVGDRYYAFFALRAESYGDNYGFDMRCSSCRFPFPHSVSILKDLDVIKSQDGDKEPFEVDLPYSHDKLQFRLLRGKDEEDIDRRLDKLFKARSKGARLGKGGIPIDKGKSKDPTYRFRLAKHVVSVNDIELDFDEAFEWITTLKAPDSLVMRQSIDEHDPRIDIELSVECPKCQYINRTSLPFTRELVFPR